MTVKRLENGKSVRVELKTAFKLTPREDHNSWQVANTAPVACLATLPVSKMIS